MIKIKASGARKLMRKAQVNIAIHRFIGYGLHEELPHHSSLTRIRQRWGEERFRTIFKRTVEACLQAKTTCSTCSAIGSPAEPCVYFAVRLC
jgi:hypothetical protein